MKSTLTIPWVVVVLIAAIFGYRALSFPNRAGVVQTVDEGRMVAKAGMDYLFHLRLEGRLPGITTTEHGNASISGGLSRYPYSLTMRFNKQGEASTNNYTILQLKKDSPWQLKRAWQTDSNGQIIQEWSVR